jgi:hypothetical protein
LDWPPSASPASTHPHRWRLLQCIYFFEEYGRGPCFVFDGPKKFVTWFRNYLVVVTPTKNPIKVGPNGMPQRGAARVAVAGGVTGLSMQKK